MTTLKRQPVIFCDFDGTVTKSDNIIAAMKQFAPDEWVSLKDKVLSQQISIQDGVGEMFSLLSSSKREEITNFIVQQAEIRAGFDRFIAYAKEHEIPLYIVSGGIDFFVKPLLKGRIEEEYIYCNKADFSNEYISITWPHSCDEQCDNGCGCCKPSIIRKIANDTSYKVVIGDSITDLQAAKLADKVIARDFLIEKCEENKLAYESFETFDDVIAILQRLEVTV